MLVHCFWLLDSNLGLNSEFVCSLFGLEKNLDLKKKKEKKKRKPTQPAAAQQPNPAPLAAHRSPPQPTGIAEADTRDPRVIPHLAAESDPDSACAAPPPSSPRARLPSRAHAARRLCALFNRRRATLGPPARTLALLCTRADA